MRRRSLFAAVAAVLLGAAAFAQTGGRHDPLTGKWGSEGVTYLELQYNGEGSVTGTTIWRDDGYEERAPIVKGTFDAETGAVKLTGEAKGREGKVVPYAIDGRLERGTLSGTYQMGTDKGEFAFTRQ
jgi:hypothetical protein